MRPLCESTRTEASAQPSPLFDHPGLFVCIRLVDALRVLPQLCHFPIEVDCIPRVSPVRCEVAPITANDVRGDWQIRSRVRNNLVSSARTTQLRSIELVHKQIHPWHTFMRRSTLQRRRSATKSQEL